MRLQDLLREEREEAREEGQIEIQKENILELLDENGIAAESINKYSAVFYFLQKIVIFYKA